MRQERFIILAALLFMAAPASAQPHPCDISPPSVTTVEAGTSFTLAGCHSSKDTAGNPTIVTGWVLSRNGVVVPGATVIMDLAPNTAGDRYVHIARTEAAPAVNVVYALAAVNDKGTGAAFSFPSLSVTPARTVPTALVKGRIVVP